MVRSAISETLERAGIGKEVRATMLHDLAFKRVGVVEHYDSDGVLKERQVYDNDAQRLKAIALAAKISGDYDSAREAAHMQAKAVQPIMDYWAKRIRSELSLKPPLNDDVGPTVNAGMVDVGESMVDAGDAVVGSGERSEGSPEQGQGQQEEGGGG
jgi:hypothetical protein